MAPQVGLEPTTLRLTAGCSAIELLRNIGLTLRPPERTANHDLSRIRRKRVNAAVNGGGLASSAVTRPSQPRVGQPQLRVLRAFALRPPRGSRSRAGCRRARPRRASSCSRRVSTDSARISVAVPPSWRTRTAVRPSGQPHGRCNSALAAIASPEGFGLGHQGWQNLLYPIEPKIELIDDVVQGQCVHRVLPRDFRRKTRAQPVRTGSPRSYHRHLRKGRHQVTS